jgi:hypothetical protein
VKSRVAAACDSRCLRKIKQRPGGGRRKGSLNRRTKALRAIAAEALESGVTPLEVMLENMRFFHAEAEELLARVTSGLEDDERSGDLLQLLAKLRHFRLEAQRCAVDAAPYLHPRLRPSPWPLTRSGLRFERSPTI